MSIAPPEDNIPCRVKGILRFSTVKKPKGLHYERVSWV